MTKELLVSSTSNETRVALLENGHIAEIYFERGHEKGIVGNIYLGKVIRVLPGMQAAFVDIGLEKAAFLYVADVRSEIEALEEFIDEEQRDADGETAVENVLHPFPPIEDLLQEGQEILVEVSKEPLGTKGARITSYITLPGRHLVYMPTVDHIGISRRIENEDEKERLRSLIESLRRPGTGFIVRTAAEGKDEDDLRHDVAYLTGLWEEIQQHRENKSPPALIHSDLDVTSRVLRDILTEDVERLVVDSEEEYHKTQNFIHRFMPKLRVAVDLYRGNDPIFDAFGLEIEIARALGRKVWLKSGGYITVEQTEALTAIDVNTGRFVGKHNLEDTIFQTNLEAVREIAFQLRLRNIGGLIVIDFIDMEKEIHREKVHAALEEALLKDKSKTNILPISELGLIEMTRKRVRESIGRTLCEPCPYCEGKGYVKSRTTMAYEILRELERDMQDVAGSNLTLLVHPDIAAFLYDEEHDGIESLEKFYSKRITIKVRQGYHIEQYEIFED